MVNFWGPAPPLKAPNRPVAYMLHNLLRKRRVLKDKGYVSHTGNGGQQKLYLYLAAYDMRYIYEKNNVKSP